jgi:hypothetical protein
MTRNLTTARVLYFICAALLLHTAAAFSQGSKEIGLSANLTKADIDFKESVKLNLIVEWEGTMANYLFEPFPLPETENLIVMGTSSKVSSAHGVEGEITRREFEYTLQPTQGGTGIIQPIVLKYISLPDSIPGELMTQQFKLNIAEPEIQTPSNQKSGVSLYFVIPVALMAVGGLIIIAMVFFRKRPQKPPEKSSEEIFVAELQEIKKLSQSDRKSFFAKLYKLLSDYIYMKFSINTIGKSAKDISLEILETKMTQDCKDKISAWLTLAEKEKFAPFEGEPGDTIRLVNDIEKFFHRIGKGSISEDS